MCVHFQKQKQNSLECLRAQTKCCEDALKVKAFIELESKKKKN